MCHPSYPSFTGVESLTISMHDLAGNDTEQVRLSCRYRVLSCVNISRVFALLYVTLMNERFDRHLSTVLQDLKSCSLKNHAVL